MFDPWHYGDPSVNAATLGERIVQPSRLDDPADDCSGEATAENLMGQIVDCMPEGFEFVDRHNLNLADMSYLEKKL